MEIQFFRNDFSQKNKQFFKLTRPGKNGFSGIKKTFFSEISFGPSLFVVSSCKIYENNSLIFFKKYSPCMN